MDSNILGLRPSYTAVTGLSDPSVPPCPHFLRSFRTSYITFRHPGYSGPGNILCRLPAYDGLRMNHDACADDDANAGVLGLHYGTALQACSIIACNAQGILSATILDITAQPDPPSDWEVLLTAKVYYFYPSAWIASRDPAGLVYPVCPGFQDWQFPHGLLPKEWVSVYVCYPLTLLNTTRTNDGPRNLANPFNVYPPRANTPPQSSCAMGAVVSRTSMTAPRQPMWFRSGNMSGLVPFPSNSRFRLLTRANIGETAVRTERNGSLQPQHKTIGWSPHLRHREPPLPPHRHPHAARFRESSLRPEGQHITCPFPHRNSAIRTNVSQPRDGAVPNRTRIFVCAVRVGGAATRTGVCREEWCQDPGLECGVLYVGG